MGPGGGGRWEGPGKSGRRENCSLDVMYDRILIIIRRNDTEKKVCMYRIKR